MGNKYFLICGQWITALFLVVLAAGCSTQAWYEGFSKSAEIECEKMQQGAREDCLQRINRRSYDEYSKERKQ